ncbi:hypothetical protein QO010_003984 [Caulobacter ginsengisoli]|uniref:Lipocalin-like domain-containing protein n=1 Tax=Caulobacter ginsengisoli TaxID=400775 RepID=A0ABU0IVZ6_9CAUL|nr:lipocalin-like domain-containing protein [Caulobacter ginsengisoli]MDQ0466191.1 hypothetical protein [Caulobacter ginsengisoli]
MTRLSDGLPGSWRLISRIDTGPDGERRPEPVLGEDPVALLIYDRSGHFSAQFMRRDRTGAAGFDAYFGTYEVDDATGTVTQSLAGALNPALVGAVLTRTMNLEGDSLTIRLDTVVGGTAVVRTLTWVRVG